jgi:PAS domain S-box-containing protein
VNSRFSQETGYGKKDVVGKNMKELGYLFEQKSFADVLTKFQARWGGKTVRSYIAQVITKSGKVREYEITAKMIKAKKGEQMRELAVFHDVTEERKARKIIRDANRRLEEMVERRTTELRKAQGQLVQQEKMAALGKMASVFAHEIRNPLGVMKLAAYSLRKLAKDGDKKALSHLRHIDEKIEESNRIIHDMLVFARGTSIVKTEVDLNKLVQKTCDENGEMIRAMGVEVKKELDPNMTTFMADPVHVTEVLCNLATNAAQAMEKKKKKRITIRTYQKDKWVYLEVQDTGMGMTKETQKRLGEPFFSTKVKGIGLGLYITYEIVKKHGGTISVVSELGKGTTFTIALPVNTNAYDKKTKNSHR